MTDEPKTDAIGAEAKPAKGKPAKEKRGPQLVPKPGATKMNVTQLAHMKGGYNRSHASRHDYYGVPGCKFNPKTDKPTRFNIAVAKAIFAKDAEKEAGKQLSAPVATVIVGRNLAAGEEPPYGSPEWALWRDESRRLATEAAAAAPPSDLPFEYQPYSALKAGRNVAPGFESSTLDEFDRNEKELRRRGYLYDTDDNY